MKQVSEVEVVEHGPEGPEPVVVKIKSVGFLVPQEIPNRGTLGKIAADMEGLELEELANGDVLVKPTDLRSKWVLKIPVTSIGIIRYETQ